MLQVNQICRGYLVLVTIICINGATVQKPRNENTNQKVFDEPSIDVECHSEFMIVLLKNIRGLHPHGLFSGMIYPKGLPKNSTCLSEYRHQDEPLEYQLPLRSCNTMSQETDNGDIEFFNTIVVQPHLKLVTDLGRGFHVQCKYKNRQLIRGINITKIESLSTLLKNSGYPEAYQRSTEKKLEFIKQDYSNRSDFGRSFAEAFDNLRKNYNSVRNTTENNVNNFHNLTTENDFHGDLPIPGIHMKIYNEDKVAKSVNIGDPLQLTIYIEKQNTFGLHITNCLVRDGLGWGEQKLINEFGCPTDNEIMGSFQYDKDKMIASVTFPAHKFPYTASVYYQCNVRLCMRETNDCFKFSECNERKRQKRQATENSEEDLPAIIEVYSGLYVNENADVIENDHVIRKKTNGENELCVSQRTFAICIAVAGLMLMLVIVASVVCIMTKKRTKLLSNSESSIYSGPYTNTAFSHSS